MEMKVQVQFKQLMTIVKTLTPIQKAKLRAELNEKQVKKKQQDEFIDYLLKGPVYNENDVQIIEENIKSIAAWRTKS